MWCSQSGDHLENNLAKCGYILVDMKVGGPKKKEKKKKRILPYSWLPAGTCHTDLAIWKKGFSKSGEFGLFFLPLKSLCVLGPNQILEVELLARIR